MLLDRLEDVEHARFRALAQIIIDKESGIEAFEDYMKVAFPSLAQRKESKKEEARQALMSWVREGPMRVTPLGQPNTAKSRLKSRVVARMMDKERSDFHGSVAKKWNQQHGM